MTKFVTITNKNIYDEIRAFHKLNNYQHNEIIANQIRTNGKVKLVYWIATTALSIALIVGGLKLI